MPVHAFEPPRGRFEQCTVDSSALAHNVLGDPTSRTVAVYLPEGYDSSDEDGERAAPSLKETKHSIAATIYSVWRGRMIGNTIDPDLKSPLVDEFTFGIEHEIFDNVLGGIWIDAGNDGAVIEGNRISGGEVDREGGVGHAHDVLAAWNVVGRQRERVAARELNRPAGELPDSHLRAL